MTKSRITKWLNAARQHGAIAWLVRNTPRLSVTLPVLVIIVPALASLLGEILNDKNLVLREIAVPPALAAQGYNSFIMARMIGDAYYQFSSEAATLMKPKDLVIGASSGIAVDRPKLAVSDPNQTLASVFAYILSFLHLSHHYEISGEVVATGKGTLLLTLRLNGRKIETNSITAATPEGLSRPAAETIMRKLQPAILATWYYRRNDASKGDYKTASGIANNIILWHTDNDPNVLPAHNLLGLILRNSGDFVGAIKEFHAAERSDSYNPLPHINLATVYYAQSSLAPDKLYAGLWEARRAVQLDPGSAAAHITLGNIYLQMKKIDNASREYRVALLYDRTNAVAHVNLGYAYSRQDRAGEAEAEYLLAIAYAPQDLYAHNNLARLYWKHSRLDEATREYQAAIKIGPKDFHVFINLASVLVQRAGQPHAAAQALRQQACDTLDAGMRRFKLDGDYARSNQNYPSEARSLINREKLSCSLAEKN